MHCIGSPTLSAALTRLDECKVSAHYLIPQISGREVQQLLPELFSHYSLNFPGRAPALQLVKDSDKAWHAGISSFATFNRHHECSKSLNPCTIGIEFHAPYYAGSDGSDWYQFASYSNLQEETGIALTGYLTNLHNIPKTHILAHSTIAAGRKTDPGPLFFWDKLNKAGLGYLPPYIPPQEEEGNKIRLLQQKLYEAGFTTCPINGALDGATKDNIDAFVMQFAPDLWRGKHTPLCDELLGRVEGFNKTTFNAG